MWFLWLMWKELLALMVSVGVVVSVLTVFVRGGLFIPLTGAVVVFVLGWGILCYRAAARVRRGSTSRLPTVTIGTVNFYSLTPEQMAPATGNADVRSELTPGDTEAND